MKTVPLRIKPGEDLKEQIQKFVQEHNVQAGIVLTCVGSLKKAKLRMANEKKETTYEEKFEILSLVGTLSNNGVHLHIALADKDGKTIGGHLKEGCIIYTTAEIVIGILEEYKFSREFDQDTGFKELVILKA